jgi:hypothetical protein
LVSFHRVCWDLQQLHQQHLEGPVHLQVDGTEDTATIALAIVQALVLEQGRMSEAAEHNLNLQQGQLEWSTRTTGRVQVPEQVPVSDMPHTDRTLTLIGMLSSYQLPCTVLRHMEIVRMMVYW